MQVQDLLFELAPDLLNGIEPRSIGRQKHQGDLAALQRRQYIWLKMDWPVVQRDVDALRTRIAPFHRLQITQKGLVIESTALPTNQASRVGIQTACNAPRGVVASALNRPWRIAARRRVVTEDRGTAVVGQFILIEEHQARGIGLHLLPHAAQPCRFGGIVGIR